MDSQFMAQIAPYQPWLTLGGVLVFFLLLRITRRALRQRVEELGRRWLRERGRLIWFWINAPGVMVHELSHAFVILLFRPFGFRLTSVTLFRIQPMVQRDAYGRVMSRSGPPSLQLGEVQYTRPQNRFMSYVGDGLSGTAPLVGGVAAFIFLYWVATGYLVWDFSLDASHQFLQILRPGWPWWTLIFAPYLILTVTSELWPSRQDWRGARNFVIGLSFLLILLALALWYYHQLPTVLTFTTFAASRIDFALLILLALDIAFLLIAETLVKITHP